MTPPTGSYKISQDHTLGSLCFIKIHEDPRARSLTYAHLNLEQCDFCQF